MHKSVAVLLIALALSGCAKQDDQPQLVEEPEERLTLSGIVQDRDVVPIAGATVTIRDTELNFTTGLDGRFNFPDLEDGFYILDAKAPDYSDATVTHSPGAPSEKLFVLDRTTIDPFFDTVPFSGIIECAAEYLIITPSCDTIIEYVNDEVTGLPNGGSITSDDAEFDVTINPDWQTIVVDVVFDISDQPGLEALRTVFSGINDANELTSYDQFGRFQGPTSYTFRIEPGATYPDGIGPVNGNLTAFRLNVYGQGHGWHTVCETLDDPSTCTLGVGAGIDVSFDLFVTTFYVEPAPMGWSFRA